MTISLYEATVTGFLQTLGGVAGFLQKGLDHCRETGGDPQALVDGRLVEDMLPLAFQIKSVHHHSANAVAAVREGLFGPPSRDLPQDYAALQALVAEAQESLRALTPEDIAALADNTVEFPIGERTLRFTGKDFLLSFSVPNFLFHATMAYALLRQSGAPLGKRDFMGQMRLKA